MIELERKFLVNKLPNLKNIKNKEICQGYLNINSEPILRIRKYGTKYFLTYKYKNDLTKSQKVNSCIEYELPITKKAYENLSKKIEGINIIKTRYYIKLNDKLTAELDIFHEGLDGLRMVEVEFNSLEDANKFVIPDWFGPEVTNDKKYRNSNLSQKRISKR